MDNTTKRRLFLSGIVGLLIGAPVAVRLMSGKPDRVKAHKFSKLLTKYQQQTACDIASTTGPASFQLPLSPPKGAEWQYLLFYPALYPTEISLALGDEPDAFFAREGVLLFSENQKGQKIITGGDVFSGLVSPVGEDAKENKVVTIMVRDGKLVSVKPKGTSAPSNQDIQLAHLLALDVPQNKELRVGMKWTGQAGRVKPFKGYPTRYEIAGFADVNGRPTAHVRFEGMISNIAGEKEFDKTVFDKNAVCSNKHRGDCYFDLETGFLIRQETEMEIQNKGIQGFVSAKDESKILTIQYKSVIQVVPS